MPLRFVEQCTAQRCPPSGGFCQAGFLFAESGPCGRACCTWKRTTGRRRSTSTRPSSSLKRIATLSSTHFQRWKATTCSMMPMGIANFLFRSTNMCQPAVSLHACIGVWLSQDHAHKLRGVLYGHTGTQYLHVQSPALPFQGAGNSRHNSSFLPGGSTGV